MKLPRFFGLQRRIMTYVTVGLLALFALLAGLTWRAIQQSSALIAEQRLSLAGMLAMHLDSALSHAFVDVDSTAATLARIGDAGAPRGSELGQLHEHLSEEGDLEVLRCVAIVNAAGEVLLAEPAAAGGACQLPVAGDLPARAFAAGRQVHEAQPVGPEEPPLVRIASPIGTSDGTAGGALVLSLRPTLRGTSLQALLAAAESQRGYRVELLSDGGAVATSAVEPAAFATAHWGMIAADVGLGHSGLMQHRINRPGTATKGHFIAYTPLRALPWAVVVEQPFDLAVALPYALRDQMLAAGALGLLAALAVAWITTRQVIRPLSALSAAAHRIARGDLGQPISPGGHDEVRSLGITLEEMRQRLKALLEEREQWGHELERQVAARTRELEQRNVELGAAGEENRRLYLQVLEKERQRRRLLERTMTAFEEERKRVARELHDEIGQALTGLIMTLDSLMAGESRSRVPRRALLDLRDLTSSTLQEVRRMIAALRPSLLDDLGLVPAIQSYAKTTLGAAAVDYRIEAPTLDLRLGATLETALFRIAQEAITNVVRHAHARQVLICLRGGPDAAEIEVQDDGDGFDAGLAASATGNGSPRGVDLHVGLLGMRERAELLGGQFEIVSSPGQGTRVRASIPIGPHNLGRRADPRLPVRAA